MSSQNRNTAAKKGALALLRVLGLVRGLRLRFLAAETRVALLPGVIYRRTIRRRPFPLIIHAVYLPLTLPGLRFLVTPRDGRGTYPLAARATSAFLRERGAQLAISGDFFEPWHARSPWDYYPRSGDPVQVMGRACSDGDWYANSPKRMRHPALFLSRENRAFIGLAPPEGFQPYNVISGNQVFLERGQPCGWSDGDRHPRAVVALDPREETLLLLVIDGRQPGYSEGVTIEELSEVALECGATTALNLDGGGSVTLAFAPRPGMVRLLNRPIQTGIPGRERPIANHLGVFLPLEESLT